MSKKICLIFIICIILTGWFVFCQDTQEKTIDVKSFLNDKVWDRISTPQLAWLNNNTMLLYDGRVDEEQRTLELYDPAAEKHAVAIDKEKVLSVLKEELGEDAPEAIEWPDAIESNGSVIAYLIENDIFSIELNNSAVKRLTKTEAEEESVAFSPDGRWVSFIRNNDIYLIDWKNSKEKQITTGGTETLLNGKLSWVYWEEIYEHVDVPYSWSADSTAIAYLQSDDSQVPTHTFVSYKPVVPKVVVQHYPKAGQTNPTVRLGIVEIETGETTWVDCGEYEYLARFKWLPGDKEIAVQTMNRKQNELKLFFAERATGESRLILEEKDSCWLNLNYAPFFIKQMNQFIWLSERDGNQHAYLYDFNGKLLRQITKGKYNIESAVDEITGKKARWFYFTSNKKSLIEQHLYRVSLDGKKLEKLSNGHGYHSAKFSPDMNYYLEIYSNASSLPEITLHNADGKNLMLVAPAVADFLKEERYSSPEFHTFKTEDGLELPAMIMKPVDFDPGKKYPALIYVYGGPRAQQVHDVWSRRLQYFHVFAKAGYFTFVLDIRSGLEKNKALENSAYKQAYGMQNVRDILDGVKWIKQLPSIDPERLGIWGGSGGGTTTLFVMTHSDVFKAGAALFPVTDWYYYDSIYTERFQSTPGDNSDGYKETSIVLAAEHLKGHLLITHGTYDDNVHPQNTYAFINELIKHNIQFELMIYPWRKHGTSDEAARIHSYTLMLEFWERYL
ncbi:MAG: hypothetical protein A2Y62_01090 [Candidatus Fischerbacteria bacterium RBG_13_37_8]|uniref:Peptidase S9 n=1 Tax=Candidatus Fischerbacteria bacterium RBG_13_37_8 TaxID=1817863 RepID=A0A1F5VT99_9BACT|nr:MAG: hypothetical protein A2Y62_01090 [Candidatus Fischerbacteria bacterium RBG_13_37_8]